MTFRLSNTLLTAAVLSLCACGGSGQDENRRPDFGSKPPPRTENGRPVYLKIEPPLPEHAAEIQTVLNETNRMRKEKGLPPLRHNPILTAYAQLRAAENAERFLKEQKMDHVRPNGTHFASGLNYGGHKTQTSGENLGASSPLDTQGTLDSWRNSPLHYANITRKDFTEIGIGLVKIPEKNAAHLPKEQRFTYYWAQIFSTSNDVDSPYRFAEILKGGQMSQTADGFRQPAQALNHQTENWLDYLLMDGMTIPLKLSEKDGLSPLKTGSYSGVAGGGQYSRYGVAGRENRWNAFYQGVPTKQMPQSNRASYLGHGVSANNDRFTAQFEADFDRRTFNGSLSENGNVRFDIQTEIRGNTFASPSGAKVAAEGGFFGDDAAEMAGVFRDTSSGEGGAFGGKRQ